MKIPAVFKNEVLYYVVLAFSVLNVLGYVSMKAWECLALFSLTAYIVNMQVDNVTVGLLAGIFVANFVFSCGRVKEGVDKTLQKPEEDVKEAENALEHFASFFNYTGTFWHISVVSITHDIDLIPFICFCSTLICGIIYAMLFVQCIFL